MNWKNVSSCIAATALIFLVGLISAVLMNETKGVSDAERFDDNNVSVHDGGIAFKKKVQRTRRVDDVALARKKIKRHDVIPLEFYAYNLPEPLPRVGNDSRLLAESILIVNRSNDSNVNVFRLIQFDLSEALALEAAAMCENFPLKGRAQRDVCQHYPTAMTAIIRGVQLAINRTKIDLQKRKWDGSSLTNPKFGQNLLKKACKETAFSHAVISAGIAYAVTESCYQGEIRNCQCDNGLKRGPWDGCSADVKFGVKISGQLMDGAETSHSFHSEINIYNNRVGRLAVERSREEKCYCHGMSGACTIMTCFMQLPPFSRITKNLVEAYNHPVKTASNDVGRPMRPSEWKLKNQAKEDQLVYLSPSPNFCRKSVREGSVGTKGRLCELEHGHEGSCRTLCCGRGSKVQQKVNLRKCHCSFQFCCSVRCKTCKDTELYHVCR
ncbi:protein Wnt-7b-like [Oscarella lobularis]|uniref:protein Wnt-7b-like n=1 Tax=Oscarella lobularis TaxID=121494 RepID=UPI003314218C